MTSTDAVSLDGLQDFHERSRWQRYEEYEPCRVNWVPEVPSHWDVWKLPHAFGTIGSGTTPKSDDENFYDGDVPWVTTSELRETLITGTTKKLTASALQQYPTLRTYPEGTLLFAMYGATIGRLGLLGIPATVNQACCAFSNPRTLDPKFVYYWLQARRPILIGLSSGGGQPNLSQDDLKQIRIPAPDLDEQRGIAGFLDGETSKIDALVRKKERLIELLQEKRTALISHAVTRGLNPNAPMRAVAGRGFDELPAHWQYAKMRWYLESLRDGTHNPPPRLDGVHRLLSVRNVQNGVFACRDDDRTMTPDAFAELQRSYTVKEGDVVLAIVGATTGKSALVGKMENVTVQRSLGILRPRKRKLRGDFLNHWIQSTPLQTQIKETVDQYAAQPGIYLDDVANLCVPIPPMEEQERIVAAIDAETAKMDALIAKVTLAIERLREYRTALISAAVTGKIDVRNHPAAKAASEPA